MDADHLINIWRSLDNNCTIVIDFQNGERTLLVSKFPLNISRGHIDLLSYPILMGNTPPILPFIVFNDVVLPFLVDDTPIGDVK